MSPVAAVAPPPALELVPGVVARNPCAEDQGYVLTTWLRSMRQAEPYHSQPKRRYFGRVGDQLDRLFDGGRNATRVLIAAVAGDQDRIAGWVCYSPISGAPTIHYVYVREGADEADRYRRRGLARALLATVLRSDPAGPTRAPIYTSIGPGLRYLTRLYPHAVYMALEDFLA